MNVNRRTLGARRTLTRRHPARGRGSAWTRQSDLYASPHLALVARCSSGGLNNASTLRPMVNMLSEVVTFGSCGARERRRGLPAVSDEGDSRAHLRGCSACTRTATPTRGLGAALGAAAHVDEHIRCRGDD